MFRNNAIEVRAALAMISDASEVLSILLGGGHSTIAGRLAGAFRNIGRDEIADEIIKGMKAADYTVNEIDPFGEVSSLILGAREPSPYVTRIRLMWQKMRGPVIEVFPTLPEKETDNAAYLKNVDEIFVADAYHSLSIEGYRVSEALIERIRDGKWDPDNDDEDLEHRNVLAARGYYEAFQHVKGSVKKVLEGANAGEIAKQDHGDWYRALFAPGVTAGIIRPADLAGYRNGPVYIRQSMHVPPPKEAVRDLMPALFNLLRDEEHPAVRNVLGHFIFVYIHPYFDGNGRMGRFLMNVMMASGGYPWTVITVDERDAYMGALEQASVQGDIVPFAKFLAKLL
jgi:fido (protein-threonine AMPylation protein)